MQHPPEVRALYRYPVKSMAGEPLQEAIITGGGVVGDRAFCLTAPGSGLVASAKRPDVWGQLLHFAARGVDAAGTVVEIHPTEGTAVRSDAADVHDRLSAVIGRSVRLVSANDVDDPRIERTDPDGEALAEGMDLRLGPSATDILGREAPVGTLVDFAPLHLVSTATLTALDAHGPTAGDPRRLRPNIVLTAAEPFEEARWVGRRLVSQDLVIEIILESPRCVVPSLPQLGLEASVATLRAVAKRNRVELPPFGRHSCAGVYGRIVEGGVLAVGDRLTLHP